MEINTSYRPLPLTLIFGFLLLILAGISNYLHFIGLKSQFETSVQAQAQMIIENIAPALQFMDDATATSILNSLHSNADIQSALVENQAGSLFAGWLTYKKQVYDYRQSPITIAHRRYDQRLTLPIIVANQKTGSLIVDYSLETLLKKIAISIIGTISVILIMMLVTYFLLVRINQVQKSKQKIEQDHRQTTDSIKYASLIQNAFMPRAIDFDRYFSEHFAIWRPKDIVGGDIYTLIPLRNEHEVLLMVIDCTGHGVPGAFVSMLVKAIEQQIITKLMHQHDEISPAHILTMFNQSLKSLLKQQDLPEQATQVPIQHAGFDGGIIYYNTQTQLLKFSGANTSLFYSMNEQILDIKGDRQSVGDHTSSTHYEFKDHLLSVHYGTSIYLTTDGFTDQNGGEKGLPFGKKRFMQLLKKYQHKPLSYQAQELFMALQDYKKNDAQTDDITLIGVRI